MSDDIYKGIAYPFSKGETSFPRTATNEDLIKQSLIQIIMTTKGERVMRPEFGSSAFGFVFETDNAALAAFIRTEVANAISRNEPRVLLTGVSVTKDEKQGVLVTIEFVVPATGQKQSVSVPLGTGGS